MIRVNNGLSSFASMRNEGWYYVDKTGFLLDFLENHDTVSLFTRPRRFGKSLFLSMLRSFFDINQEAQARETEVASGNIFEGLKISENRELCSRWMHRYPVLHISFKDFHGLDFATALSRFVNVVNSSCPPLESVLASKQRMDRLNGYDRDCLHRIFSKNMDRTSMESVLTDISRILYKAFDARVIVLIDEYDVPLKYACEYGYYDEMSDFIQILLSSSLKDSPYLKFAVLTGCLGVVSESLFTGLNNCTCFDINARRYSNTFGFTQGEVDVLLEKANLQRYGELVRKWYCGYRFGETRQLYCPWDVMQYVRSVTFQDPKNVSPKSYWVNTSSDEIFLRLLDGPGQRKETERLLAGESIRCSLATTVTYRTLLEEPRALWTLLQATGYLTMAGGSVDEANRAWLTIPNLAVREAFLSVVDAWTRRKVAGKNWDSFFAAFWKADGDAVCLELEKWFLTSIRYFHAGEDVHHAVLQTIFSLRCAVRSHKARGDGRPDFTAIEYGGKGNAAVLALGYAGSSASLEKEAQKALERIKDSVYEEELCGCRTIVLCGLAFCGRSCAAKMEKVTDSQVKHTPCGATR